jgi:putative SOS response-associated peptidase YedK
LEPAYAVLTRPARPPVSEIHDREPVTLRRTEVDDYLSCELSSDHLKEVEGVELRSRQASVSANNPQNTGRDVTRRKTASLEDY